MNADNAGPPPPESVLRLRQRIAKTLRKNKVLIHDLDDKELETILMQDYLRKAEWAQEVNYALDAKGILNKGDKQYKMLSSTVAILFGQITNWSQEVTTTLWPSYLLALQSGRPAYKTEFKLPEAKYYKTYIGKNKITPIYNYVTTDLGLELHGEAQLYVKQNEPARLTYDVVDRLIRIPSKDVTKAIEGPLAYRRIEQNGCNLILLDSSIARWMKPDETSFVKAWSHIMARTNTDVIIADEALVEPVKKMLEEVQNDEITPQSEEEERIAKTLKSWRHRNIVAGDEHERLASYAVFWNEDRVEPVNGDKMGWDDPTRIATMVLFEMKNKIPINNYYLEEVTPKFMKWLDTEPDQRKPVKDMILDTYEAAWNSKIVPRIESIDQTRIKIDKDEIMFNLAAGQSLTLPPETFLKNKTTWSRRKAQSMAHLRSKLETASSTISTKELKQCLDNHFQKPDNKAGFSRAYYIIDKDFKTRYGDQHIPILKKVLNDPQHMVMTQEQIVERLQQRERIPFPDDEEKSFELASRIMNLGPGKEVTKGHDGLIMSHIANYCELHSYADRQKDQDFFKKTRCQKCLDSFSIVKTMTEPDIWSVKREGRLVMEPALWIKVVPLTKDPNKPNSVRPILIGSDWWKAVSAALAQEAKAAEEAIGDYQQAKAGERAMPSIVYLRRRISDKGYRFMRKLDIEKAFQSLHPDLVEAVIDKVAPLAGPYFKWYRDNCKIAIPKQEGRERKMTMEFFRIIVGDYQGYHHASGVYKIAKDILLFSIGKEAIVLVSDDILILAYDEEGLDELQKKIEDCIKVGGIRMNKDKQQTIEIDLSAVEYPDILDVNANLVSEHIKFDGIYLTKSLSPISHFIMIGIPIMARIKELQDHGMSQEMILNYVENHIFPQYDSAASKICDYTHEHQTIYLTHKNVPLNMVFAIKANTPPWSLTAHYLDPTHRFTSVIKTTVPYIAKPSQRYTEIFETVEIEGEEVNRKNYVSFEGKGTHAVTFNKMRFLKFMKAMPDLLTDYDNTIENLIAEFDLKRGEKPEAGIEQHMETYFSLEEEEGHLKADMPFRIVYKEIQPETKEKLIEWNPIPKELLPRPTTPRRDDKLNEVDRIIRENSILKAIFCRKKTPAHHVVEQGNLGKRELNLRKDLEIEQGFNPNYDYKLQKKEKRSKKVTDDELHALNETLKQQRRVKPTLTQQEERLKKADLKGETKLSPSYFNMFQGVQPKGLQKKSIPKDDIEEIVPAMIVKNKTGNGLSKVKVQKTPSAKPQTAEEHTETKASPRQTLIEEAMKRATQGANFIQGRPN